MAELDRFIAGTDSTEGQVGSNGEETSWEERSEAWQWLSFFGDADSQTNAAVLDEMRAHDREAGRATVSTAQALPALPALAPQESEMFKSGATFAAGKLAMHSTSAAGLPKIINQANNSAAAAFPATPIPQFPDRLQALKTTRKTGRARPRYRWCKVCGQRCTDQFFLTRHMTESHDYSSLSHLLKVCDQCGSFFPSKYDLSEHRKKEHEKWKRPTQAELFAVFSCKIVDQEAELAKAIATHTMQCQGDRGESSNNFFVTQDNINMENN